MRRFRPERGDSACEQPGHLVEGSLLGRGDFRGEAKEPAGGLGDVSCALEAGLVAPDGLVEIMMTAVKNRQRGFSRAATRLPQGVGQ